MLSLATFRILADEKRISPGALRFVCQLLADYDMRHFRTIALEQSKAQFGCAPKRAAYYLAQLVSVGILEVIRRDSRPWQSLYRLTGNARMTTAEVRSWGTETRRFCQRLAIAPASVPDDPAEVSGWLQGLRPSRPAGSG